MDLPRLQRGFTLIELMVVITVISILATMVLYGLGHAQAAARDASRLQIMTGIQSALERYYGDCQVYPSTGFNGLFAAGTPDVCGTSLIRGGYMAVEPTDPGKTSCAGALDQPWLPCGGTAPSYSYSGGSTYTLTLIKESGGTVTFSSPQ